MTNKMTNHIRNKEESYKITVGVVSQVKLAAKAPTKNNEIIKKTTFIFEELFCGLRATQIKFIRVLNSIFIETSVQQHTLLIY